MAGALMPPLTGTRGEEAQPTAPACTAVVLSGHRARRARDKLKPPGSSGNYRGIISLLGSAGALHCWQSIGGSTAQRRASHPSVYAWIGIRRSTGDGAVGRSSVQARSGRPESKMLARSSAPHVRLVTRQDGAQNSDIARLTN